MFCYLKIIHINPAFVDICQEIQNLMPQMVLILYVGGNLVEGNRRRKKILIYKGCIFKGKFRRNIIIPNLIFSPV